MSKLAYILFSNRSEDTGKLLFRELSERRAGGYDWRWTKGRPKQNHELVLRWGNSYQPNTGAPFEINSRESNSNAARKDRMGKILHEAEDVSFPDVVFDMKSELVGDIADHNGKVFIRSSVGQSQPVRYDEPSSVRYGDVYATKNVNKLLEYRVHVVGGEVICVFSKEPYEGHENDAIRKDNNCRFRRADEITRGNNSLAEKIRNQAIAATRALSLDSAGVDILVNTETEVYVNEVNSAPGLNTPGIQRWCNAFERFIETNGMTARTDG